MRDRSFVAVCCCGVGAGAQFSTGSSRSEQGRDEKGENGVCKKTVGLTLCWVEEGASNCDVACGR